MSKVAKRNRERVLLDIGGPAYVIRGFALIFIPIGLALLPTAFWSLTSLSKIDGTLEPIGARITLFAFLLVVGLLMSAGMWFYITRYVLRLTRSPEGIDITTSRILYNVTNRYSSKDFDSFKSKDDGGFIGRGMFADTPFDTIRLKGALFPFILDCKAEIYDGRSLAEIAR